MRSIGLNPFVQLPMLLSKRFGKMRVFVLKVNLSCSVPLRCYCASSFAELRHQVELFCARLISAALPGGSQPSSPPPPPSPTAMDVVVSSAGAAFQSHGVEMRDKSLLGQVRPEQQEPPGASRSIPMQGHPHAGTSPWLSLPGRGSGAWLPVSPAPTWHSGPELPEPSRWWLLLGAISHPGQPPASNGARRWRGASLSSGFLVVVSRVKWVICIKITAGMLKYWEAEIRGKSDWDFFFFGCPNIPFFPEDILL